MKYFKYLLTAVFMTAVASFSEVSAKEKVVPKVYMFGFSASFNDSTVYFTDIQTVDNAWIETKEKFLLGRESYSYQLKNYLAGTMRQPDRTCIVIYAQKRKDVEKKYMKMKKKYTVKTNGKYDVKYINANEFKFKTVNMSSEEETVSVDSFNQ
ncbi:hypothetical protein [Xylanibacter muris]|uniref:DUF3108 domain-containing protein n=1 Tax=Xylanibacter muris TaxID=2736290 RepID=A0ABX2AM70_9BACT|nr:hypothetical protein [Xylanibacter muris]NPD92311.1 hypothetical protein [Xylanibacter muris]